MATFCWLHNPDHGWLHNTGQRQLELERIYIKREFQGKGFGKILINYSMEIARKRLKRYLWLGVWEKNANAIAFYGKMGFRVAGHHKFRMGDEAQQDLIMKMDLEY